MSTTVHPSPAAWAAAHRLLLVLAVAVLAAVTVAVVLVAVPRNSSVPSPGGPLTTVDDGCAEVGPATPC
ncbi:hypothetical protein [Petropleomorpha daqingensis]|uniref:Uncharacterized protein n=1 Tax=Petropleomorpha daqingensis TaxID=2026353 RepID=A0A853CMA3_9ACTN|nr:hypothetical protein [Petropleomorpha daqingensis]NYJ07388.1 hypothetical protein [Petropleomorpha daqingensis]